MFRLALLGLALGGLHGSAAEFTVRVDISKAANLTPLVEPTEALVREWYPKLNALLYGPEHALPFNEVVVYAPTLKSEVQGSVVLKATTFTNTIAMPADLLEGANWDFRPLLRHELAHVCQHYHRRLRCSGIFGLSCFIYTRFTDTNPGLKWLTEGIAEFALQKFYLKNLEPCLHVDRNGLLNRYDDSRQQLVGLEQKKVQLERRGYIHGYQVAAAFLLWIEERKSPDIIRRLNAELEHGRARASVFRKLLGEDVNTLWEEFLADSRSVSPSTPRNRTHPVYFPITAYLNRRVKLSNFWIAILPPDPPAFWGKCASCRASVAAVPATEANAAQCSTVVPYFGASKATTHVGGGVPRCAVRADGIAVVATAPGLFTADASGKGQGAILNQDGVTPNSTATPAAPGGRGLVGNRLKNHRSSGRGRSAGRGCSTQAGGSRFRSYRWAAGNGGVCRRGSWHDAGDLSDQRPDARDVAPGDRVPVQVKVGGAASQDSVTVSVR
jgi:hypothetical protein